MIFEDSILFKKFIRLLKKSRRKRQCYICQGIMIKGENYISHQFKYDYNTSVVGICLKCLLKEEMQTLKKLEP